MIDELQYYKTERKFSLVGDVTYIITTSPGKNVKNRVRYRKYNKS
jgi:hypothetical protein